LPPQDEALLEKSAQEAARERRLTEQAALEAAHQRRLEELLLEQRRHEARAREARLEEQLAQQHALLRAQEAQLAALQALQAEVGAQRAKWQARRAQAATQHAAAVQRLMAECERRLEAVRARRSALQDDVEGGKRDWAEMRSQMEADLDEEALGTRRMYQERLDAERDAALKFKGENGIMRKKFASLQRDIEAARRDLQLGAAQR
jgi:hypothetical protein